MAVVTAQQPGTAPVYELRARRAGLDGLALEIWQKPSLASPQLKAPLYVAGLGGRTFSLIEHRVLRRLAKAGIGLGGVPSQGRRAFLLDEDLALTLGLLFRVLAPMRSRGNIRMVAAGIDAMAREEAAYWLGMAMHRKNPRRVLMALRFLLIDPKQQG